jgi:hypothetical protein
MGTAYLQSAHIAATNAIDVVVSGAPRAFDRAGFHDALNPDRWAIARAPAGWAPKVARVDEIAVDSTLSTAIYRLQLGSALDAGVTYSVAIDGTVLERTGAVAGSPVAGPFYVTGVGTTGPTAPVASLRRYADVAAPSTGRDLAAVQGRTLGALVRASDGDLAGASPISALRTRVLRMLTSPPNAYAHLRDWGAKARRGILARPSTLAFLQLHAERLLREDPDIADASVTITNAPAGVRRGFLYRVRIRTRSGLVDDFLTDAGEGA